MANPDLDIGALQKSRIETRADRKGAKVRQTEKDRRDVYRLVELRDGMRCRACGQKLRKDLALHPHRLEHHHIRGRGRKDSETTANICCVCLRCHEDRHVKRTLTVTGNADSTLVFTRDNQTWHG